MARLARTVQPPAANRLAAAISPETAAIAPLANEKDHKAFLAKALGSKTPKGLKFKIPASATKTGEALLKTGVALETAFVEAYLGASETLSSSELQLVASKLAANEATHFSFFDACGVPKLDFGLKSGPGRAIFGRAGEGALHRREPGHGRPAPGAEQARFAISTSRSRSDRPGLCGLAQAARRYSWISPPRRSRLLILLIDGGVDGKTETFARSGAARFSPR